MRNLGIWQRLALSYALLVALLLGLGGTALWRLRKVNERLDAALRQRYAVVDAANDAIQRHDESTRVLMQAVLISERNSPEELENLKSLVLSNERAITRDVELIERSATLPREREHLDSVRSYREAYGASITGVRNLLERGDQGEATGTLARYTLPWLELYKQSWLQFMALERQLMQDAVQQSTDAYIGARTATLVFLATVVLLAAAAAVAVTRSITRPVRELVAATGRIARGDLSFRLEAGARDELGVLAAGFNDMLGKVEDRDRQLEAHRRSLEDQVQWRTAELATANQQLQDELGERLRAQLALAAAAQEWRTTFDSIGDAVCVLDPGQRLVRANRAFLELVGAGAEAVEGRPLGELLRPVVGELEGEGGGLTQGGKTVRCAGERWLEFSRDPIVDVTGEVSGWVQLISDVTRQHSLQEQFSQAQKMEAVGRLAGGVAHDFNNLLSVILSFSGFLLEDLPEESEELRSCAREIQQASQRAAGLTRQLLAFSRKQVLKPSVLRVEEVIGGVSKMIGRLIGEDIEVTVQMGAGLGCVYMDSTNLEQALVNLAVNGRDAMPQGGKLVIEARNLDIPEADSRSHPWARQRQYVEIRVTDTGTGMAPETVERLFEPFFTTKPVGKGTGLGLAMVYGAMEQSGGHIEVESRLGEGTSFRLYLPRVASEPEEKVEGARPESPRGEGEQILVVEDDPQLRNAARRLLETAGYQVLEARDGAEGLARFEEAEGEVGLVLTDVVMPGMGGIALGKRLEEAGAGVPVLYMTGYSEEMVSGRSLVPADRVIAKPFDRAMLLQRVRALVAPPSSHRVA